MTINELEKNLKDAQREFRVYGKTTKASEWSDEKYVELHQRVIAAHNALKEFKANIPVNTVAASVERCEDAYRRDMPQKEV